MSEQPGNDDALVVELRRMNENLTKLNDLLEQFGPTVTQVASGPLGRLLSGHKR